MAASNFNLTDLVRSLQRREGNQDCFRRGLADCDEMECTWRELCMGGPFPGAHEEPQAENPR